MIEKQLGYLAEDGIFKRIKDKLYICEKCGKKSLSDIEIKKCCHVCKYCGKDLPTSNCSSVCPECNRLHRFDNAKKVDGCECFSDYYGEHYYFSADEYLEEFFSNNFYNKKYRDITEAEVLEYDHRLFVAEKNEWKGINVDDIFENELSDLYFEDWDPFEKVDYQGLKKFITEWNSKNKVTWWEAGNKEYIDLTQDAIKELMELQLDEWKDIIKRPSSSIWTDEQTTQDLVFDASVELIMGLSVHIFRGWLDGKGEVDLDTEYKDLHITRKSIAMHEFLRAMDSVDRLNGLDIKIFYPLRTSIAGKEVQMEYLKEAYNKLVEYIAVNSGYEYLNKYADRLYEELGNG